MHSTGTRGFVTGLMAVVASFLALSTSAQDAGSEDAASRGILDEVVVTAQRRDQVLEDVPISATVFSKETLELARIDDLGDYFDRTPNVNFTDVGGNRQSRAISMRGITNLAGVATTFGFYVDDFNIAATSVNPNLLDVERIEVLRGPQPTYFGRNAVGGAVNIITNKPTPDFYSRVGGGISSFSTYNLDGVVNIPVSDTFFLRGSASWEDSDGFVENVNPIGGSSGHQYNHARLAARWLITDALTADLSYDYNDETQDIADQVPTGIPQPGLIPTFVPAVDLTGTGAYPENKDKVNLDLPDRREEDINVINLRIAYEADSFIFTSLTGYVTRDLDWVRDIDFSRQDAVRGLDIYDFEDFSQEFRIQSNGTNRIDWAAGATYADFTRESDQDVISGPAFFGGAFNGLNLSDYHDINKTEAWAVFAEATFHATERLHLTAGGRYTDEKTGTQIDFISFFQDVSVPFTDTDTSDFSPRFAATYDFSESITGYGTISKGFKAGGVQPSNAFAPTYEKETLWNYELGLKGFLMDNRVRFALAVFDMKWEDLQVSARKDIVNPDTGTIQFVFATTNAAKASSTGFELELSAMATDALELGLATGYADAKFDDYAQAVVNSPPPAIVNPDGTVDLSGKQIPRSSDWNVSAHAHYSFILSDNVTSFIRGEYLYRSMFYPSTSALVSLDPYFFSVPSRDIFNLRAGVEWDTWRVMGYVENLLDDDWYTGGFDNLSYSGALVTPHPQIWGIRLEKEFE